MDTRRIEALATEAIRALDYDTDADRQKVADNLLEIMRLAKAGAVEVSGPDEPALVAEPILRVPKVGHGG